MRVTSEQFKDIVCKANRISPNAKVSFKGNAWVSENGSSDFKDYDFKEIKSVEVVFRDYSNDIDPMDELIITIKWKLNLGTN